MWFYNHLHICNRTDVVNGTTSVPKSVLHFVSGIRPSTSYLDFYKLPCYPLLLFVLLFPTTCLDGFIFYSSHCCCFLVVIVVEDFAVVIVADIAF